MEKPEAKESIITNPKALEALPDNVRDFFENVSKDITAMTADKWGKFTQSEKSLIINHPVFREIVDIFTADIAFKFTRATPAQMTALRMISRKFEIADSGRKRPIKALEHKIINIAADDSEDE